jgi:sugar phosphate isomerase/epimerase
MNRRRFLAYSAGTAGLIPRLAFAASEPHLDFPAAPRDRLSVATYPFRKLLNPKSGTMKLEDFPALVVSRFGLRMMEPLSDHFPSTDAAYLRRFKESLDKAGVRVANIPVNPHASLYDPDTQKREAAITKTKQWIDTAIALGAPSIRVSIIGVKGTKPDVEHTVESLKSIAKYGQSKNVLVNLENDDPRSEDAFFITEVITKAGNPYLRALPDFCNSMIEKDGDEAFNYAALQAMFKHAYNISHVKDSEMDGTRLYRVDVGKCFDIAKASGYRGYFSMEWEGQGEPFAGTKSLIDLSLKNLS